MCGAMVLTLKAETLQKTGPFATIHYPLSLLQRFNAKNPHSSAGPELLNSMDGFSFIVRFQMLHLQHQNREENSTEEEEEEEREEVDSAVVDPQYKYFLEHLRPHGKSYVFDAVEDGVFVKYEEEEEEQECPVLCENENKNANHVSCETREIVCLDTDVHISANAKFTGIRRGRKPKGAKKSDEKNPNDVASGSQKRRRRKLKGTKFSAEDKDSHVKIIDAASEEQEREGNSRSENPKRERVKQTEIPSGGEPKMKEELEEDALDIIIMSNVVRNWEDDGAELRKPKGEYRENLIKVLKMPYSREEHKRLLHDIKVRKPVQCHKVMRGDTKTYDGDHLGKSYLGHYPVLRRKIKSAGNDHHRVLNLLRGFFYWLKNLSHEGAFEPWKSRSCWDVLPQQ